MKRSTIVILTILVVLILDQCLKFYVKLNVPFGQDQPILGFSWANIHFVENKGMAFGFSFGGEAGKYFLSIFRIIMVGFLFYLMKGLIMGNESKGLIFCFSLIIAGAIGNIIDSMFYGLIFSASNIHNPYATLFPEGGGYAPFLQGKVVDMLYFPIVEGTWPSWIPKLGNRPFTFFSPVFNIADAAISTGVISILLFFRKFFIGGDKPSESDLTPVMDNPPSGITEEE